MNKQATMTTTETTITKSVHKKNFKNWATPAHRHTYRSTQIP